MRICVVCDKRPVVANLVSHANNKVKRWVYPNVHKVRFILVDDPQCKVQRGAVCTKCMRTGRIKKVL